MPRRSAASLPFPIVRTERLSPPADLNDDERALFVGIVSANPAEHFRPSDSPLVCSYVRAILLERLAAEHLAQGVVTFDNKPSAWLAVMAQASKQMLSLARALKLTPTARRPFATRQGQPQQLSYYDQMRLEQANGADSA